MLIEEDAAVAAVAGEAGEDIGGSNDETLLAALEWYKVAAGHGVEEAAAAVQRLVSDAAAAQHDEL